MLGSRLVTFLELLLGRRDLPGIVARSVLGIALPVVVIVYGLLCIMTRQAKVIARGGLAEIFGLPAVSVGIAYAALGVIAYVYVCWDDHPRFGGLRDAALQVLLIVIAVALAATFGLVLI